MNRTKALKTMVQEASLIYAVGFPADQREEGIKTG